MKNTNIYIFCDSSLSSGDRLLVYEAAEDIGKVFSMCKVINMDVTTDKEKNRKIADSCLAGTFNVEERADGVQVLTRLQGVRDKLSDPVAVILITANDLYLSKPKLKWCFGAARYKNRVTVQSVFRYQSLSREQTLHCIRRTLRHELGHIFGMARDLNRVNTEEAAGPHCTAPGCTLRQAGYLWQLLQYSYEEDRLDNYFCKDCLNDLNKHFNL